MQEMIDVSIDKCVGCNRCIRECPLSEVNYVSLDDLSSKVHLDSSKCIHCGACLKVCYHDSRVYRDDTEAVMRHINSGQKFTVLAAPALRTNFADTWPQILAAFRQLGADGIYDVSFGADICVWAHIRYLEKMTPKSIITQPCPVVVEYILKYRPDLIELLSPIHSPVLCLVQYLRKQQNNHNKLIFLSPCVAKSYEFRDTGAEVFNLTFKSLEQLLADKRLNLPTGGSQFDQPKSAGLGRIFSRPGGLMENIEFYLGQRLTMGRVEGSHRVYSYLNEIHDDNREMLPNILDILNCEGGCNFGTGCSNENSEITVNWLMDREKAISIEQHSQRIDSFQEFDQRLNLQDFIRCYQPKKEVLHPELKYSLEEAFELLDKHTESDRNFNCGACGCPTCREMAQKITLGLNVPANCIWKTKMNLQKNSRSVAELSSTVTANINKITKDIVRVAEALQSRNKDMVSVVATIQGISRTTKLLSFNASIEAARAGSAGKTFNVVAGEIKQLADNCSEASGRMDSMVSENQALTGDVIQNLEMVRQLIEEIQNNISLLA